MVTHISFTPTFSAKAKETGNNNSIYGLTQQPISTLILSYGTPSGLCKFSISSQLCFHFSPSFSCIGLHHISFNSLFRFSVDGTPIREFKNSETIGVPFPKNQPMRIYSSLWNADDWATRGGLVKTDWTQAPFTASYRNFNADACIWSSGASSCRSSSTPNAASSTSGSWLSQELDSTGQERLKWVQKNYMIYNYCTDTKRFPQGSPPECNSS